MSNYVEDLKDMIMEEIIQARKHKDRIEKTGLGRSVGRG